MPTALALRMALARTPLRPYLTALNCLKILERDYGHFRTSRDWSAVDRKGAPLPWYSYPAIEYLRQLDLREKSIFEYGSGNSTRFWAGAARSVLAVEDDQHWYEKVRASLPANARLELVLGRDSYIRTVGEAGDGYDVIVIDGSHRAACARAAVEHLRPGGFLVLDNADWYVRAAGFLRGTGLLQVDFTGFTPINAYTSTTSLFLRRDAELSPRAAAQPVHGMGSLVQSAADDY